MLLPAIPGARGKGWAVESNIDCLICNDSMWLAVNGSLREASGTTYSFSDILWLDCNAFFAHIASDAVHSMRKARGGGVGHVFVPEDNHTD